MFRREHQPSSDAMKAAGELHNRRSVEIAWAVPEVARERGLFWSYFPTKFSTTLRGILNAPWKTSEDRQAIFDGNAFNDELLRVAADLVVKSLPMLSSAEDPARYIDFLPGRGREAPQFADERLTRAIWAAAAVQPSLVDQDGHFRAPQNINVHPDGLPAQSLKHWSGYAGAPRDWVHPSAETRERRARVSLIMSGAGRSAASVAEWIEALVVDQTPAASATAVSLVADLTETAASIADEATGARFILTEHHGMVKPLRGRVFRRAAVNDGLAEDYVYVHNDVVTAFGLERALEALGIREADPSGRLQTLLEQDTSGWSGEQWTSFWNLTRSVEQTHMLGLLRKLPIERLGALKLKTLSGTFRTSGQCLLPGPVVPSDGSRDAHVAVDIGFHTPDGAAFDVLGVVSQPRASVVPNSGTWFQVYRKWAWEKYLATLSDQEARPNESTMVIDGVAPAGPLELLMSLSPAGRAAFIALLPERGLISRWTIQRGRSTATRSQIQSPLLWMARKHGYLNTELGLHRVAQCVSPVLAAESAMIPVAQVSRAVAGALHLPSDLRTLPDPIWRAMLERAAQSEDDSFVGRAFALVLSSGGTWPEGIATRCRVGHEWRSDIADSEIVVTSDFGEYETLQVERIPALLALMSTVPD